MNLLCDRNKCYFCGLHKPANKPHFRNLIEIHHIVEKNEGGTNSSENLVPCCSNCHSLIHLETISIDKWYNVGYSWKLKWTKNNIPYFGPFIPSDK